MLTEGSELMINLSFGFWQAGAADVTGYRATRCFTRCNKCILAAGAHWFWGLW